MNRYVAKGINVSCRTVDGEAFILNHESGLLLKLDEVGSFIWDQIVGVIILRQISEKCCQVFDGEEVQISISVMEFVEDLSTKGVVVLSVEPLSEEVLSVC